MLKAELFRLLKSKTLWLITALVIAAFFVVSVYYADNTVDKGFVTSEIAYSTVDDIPGQISKYEELMEDENLDEFWKEQYGQVVLIYRYLYEKEISYEELTEDYATIIGRYEGSEDAVSYCEFSLDTYGYIICVAMILCAALVLTGDFTGKAYLNVFGTNRSRVSIFRDRFLAYLIYFAILWLLGIIVMAVSSVQYGLPFSHLICSVLGNVFSINPVLYLAISFVMWAVFLLEYVVAVFGIAAFFKNVFVALIVPAAYYGGIVAISEATTIFGMHTYALNGLFNYIFCGLSFWGYILAFLVKLVLAGALLFLGTTVYRKRQL